MTNAWHKQAPKRPLHSPRVIWQIWWRGRESWRDREGERELELSQDTLKCRQGATQKTVCHMCLSMSRAANRRVAAYPTPSFFAGESHFDDCQCDFNTIFQLDAKLRAWAISQYQGVTPVRHVHFERTSGRDKRHTKKGCDIEERRAAWSQCWHLWIKLRFALMFYWKRPRTESSPESRVSGNCNTFLLLVAVVPSLVVRVLVVVITQLPLVHGQ